MFFSVFFQGNHNKKKQQLKINSTSTWNFERMQRTFT